MLFPFHLQLLVSSQQESKEAHQDFRQEAPSCVGVDVSATLLPISSKTRDVCGSGLARSHWPVGGTSGIGLMYNFLFLATDLTFKLPEKLYYLSSLQTLLH